MSDTIPHDTPQNNLTPETAYIYVLIDPRDNSVRYVGKAKDLKKRLNDHLRYRENTYKAHWLRELRDQGLKPLMQVIEEIPYATWPERECYWIEYYRAQGCHLTNTALGGLGGRPVGIPHSPETKAKISAAHKGKKPGKQPPRSKEWSENISKGKKGKKATPEARAKYSAAHKGKKLSDETRAKLAEANRGKKRPEQSAKMRGHEVSEETRAKISAANTGKKQSPEAIEKMASKNRGKKHSSESIEKMSAAKRGVKRAPRSEEWRQKLGDATRGKKRPPDVMEKTASKLRGRKQTPEARAKMSEAQRRRHAMRKLPPSDLPTLWD